MRGTRAFGGTAGVTPGPLVPMRRHRCTWPASSFPDRCRPGPPSGVSWPASLTLLRVVKIELSRISIHLTLSGLGLNTDTESVGVHAENDSFQRPQLVTKALEKVEGRTGVKGTESSSRRKMAPFLDRKVKEELGFAEPRESWNPGRGSLAGMGTPEMILQIKGGRERKSGFYTLPIYPQVQTPG